MEIKEYLDKLIKQYEEAAQNASSHDAHVAYKETVMELKHLRKTLPKE